jgi:hypothetical protein
MSGLSLGVKCFIEAFLYTKYTENVNLVTMTHEKQIQFWREVRNLQDTIEIKFLDNVILVLTQDGGLEFRNNVPLEIQNQVNGIYNTINNQ